MVTWRITTPLVPRRLQRLHHETVEWKVLLFDFGIDVGIGI